MELDDASQKILAHLYHHFRDSAADIAQATGLKHHQVTYRLNKFKKKGFIDRFVTLYNYSKLGYNHFHVVWIQCDERSPLRQKLRESDNVLTYGNLIGSYDLFINYIHKTEQDFEKQLQSFFANHTDNITDYSVFKVTFFEFYDLKEFGQKEPQTLELVEHTDTGQIDKIDKQILRLLEQDARKDIVDIAQRTELSSPAIIQRLKRLREHNIIQSGRALLNMSKLGYHWGELHVKFHNLSEPNKQAIIQFCRNHDHINMLNLGVSDYNGLIQVLYKSDNALRKTIRDVRDEFGQKIMQDRIVLAEEEGLVRTLPFAEYEVTE